MPDFGRIITMAYMRILGRPPDTGGLENYNDLMNRGMTEAQMRESLLRSPEYASKNPDRTEVVTASAKTGSRRKKTASRKKTTSRKKASPRTKAPRKTKKRSKRSQVA
jgi:hypothetical protein